MYVYNNQKGIKSQKQNQCKFKINPFYMVIRSHVQLMASLELETRYFLFQCPHSSYDVSIRNSETFQFNSVQLLSCVQLFATLWTSAHQASLSITSSWSLLNLMSVVLVMLIFKYQNILLLDYAFWKEYTEKHDFLGSTEKMHNSDTVLFFHLCLCFNRLTSFWSCCVMWFRLILKCALFSCLLLLILACSVNISSIAQSLKFMGGLSRFKVKYCGSRVGG